MCCRLLQDDLHLSIPMNGQHSISPEALRNTTPADLTYLYDVSSPLPCACRPPFVSPKRPVHPTMHDSAWHEQCGEQLCLSNGKA